MNQNVVTSLFSMIIDKLANTNILKDNYLLIDLLKRVNLFDLKFAVIIYLLF